MLPYLGLWMSFYVDFVSYEEEHTCAGTERSMSNKWYTNDFDSQVKVTVSLWNNPRPLVLVEH